MAEDPTPSPADAGGANQSGAAAPASATSASGGSIVARPAPEYRWKRYFLVALLFGYGLWSIHDGFVNWPRENAERASQKFPPAHTDLDINMNKGLGVLLPPLSVALLAWWLYASRGEYRFDGQALSVPGHPPVPLNAIRK